MILYLDMDGVIADFDARVAELGYPDTREDVHRCMREVKGFFRNLAVMPGAKEAVAKLEKLLPGRIRILSAVTKNDPEMAKIFRQEKIEWLGEHFPELASSALIVSDKGAIGTPEDYLADDHPTWNGAAEFPGTMIPFNGPGDWEKIIKMFSKSEGSMIKASRILRG